MTPIYRVPSLISNFPKPVAPQATCECDDGCSSTDPLANPTRTDDSLPGEPDGIERKPIRFSLASRVRWRASGPISNSVLCSVSSDRFERDDVYAARNRIYKPILRRTRLPAALLSA